MFLSDSRQILRCLVLAALFTLDLGNAKAEVRAAVAANFLNCARELGAAFETQTGIAVNIRFAATGTLYAQILNGAPFDVFLAADRERPAAAVAAGLAVKESTITYALGRLALYSERVDLGDGLNILATSSADKLAIANPQTAPYGNAALAFLRKLDLLEPWQPRLVRGNNLAQTFQFVASGNAELGLVAQSQVVGVARTRRWLVPTEMHPPIVQDAVLLSDAINPDAGTQFLGFLASTHAREIIRQRGYDTP